MTQAGATLTTGRESHLARHAEPTGHEAKHLRIRYTEIANTPGRPPGLENLKKSFQTISG